MGDVTDHLSSGRELFGLHFQQAYLKTPFACSQQPNFQPHLIYFLEGLYSSP